MIVHFAEAFRVFMENKVRSLLAMLGLIVGVSSVVAIQIAGSGMASGTAGILSGIGSQTFILFIKGRATSVRRSWLTSDDITAALAVPGVVAGMPFSSTSVIATLGRDHAKLALGGDGGPRFGTPRLRFGRLLTADDMVRVAQVCVLSDFAYQHLVHDGRNPVGGFVRIGDRRFEIVGVLERANSGLFSLDLAPQIAIPYTTFAADFAHGKRTLIAKFLVEKNSDLAAGEAAVEAVLRARHQATEFDVFDQKKVTGFIDRIIGAITLFVSFAAGISLVVAGVGIMNILLVSVTERTREIGIRMAIGASRRQILTQFTTEALLLSLLGCFGGMLVGVVIGGAVDILLIARISGSVPPMPWLRPAMITISFSMAITLLFGTYPAIRASRLDPIVALRKD